MSEATATETNQTNQTTQTEGNDPKSLLGDQNVEPEADKPAEGEAPAEGEGEESVEQQEGKASPEDDPSLIKIPEKDDDEAWDKIFSKLGRPEKPDEYNFDDIEHAELLNSEENAETAKAFREIAHKRGLSQRQAAGVMDDVMKITAEQQKQHTEALQKGVEELKKEYGEHFEERTALANKTLKTAVEKGGGDWEALSEALSRTGLANDPNLVKAISSIGRQMQQDKIWGAGGEPNELGGAGRAEIEAQIDALTAKHDVDILNGTPEGVQAQKKIDALLDKLAKSSQ